MHRALPPPEPFLAMRDDTVCGAAQLTLPLRGPSLSPLKGGEGLFCDQLQLSDMDVLQPSPIPWTALRTAEAGIFGERSKTAV
jgi:hypothetical protein